jgi:hypothetical protein
MTEKEKDPMQRWKLLPEARHHRILFFLVLIIVLAITLRLLMGW